MITTLSTLVLTLILGFAMAFVFEEFGCWLSAGAPAAPSQEDVRQGVYRRGVINHGRKKVALEGRSQSTHQHSANPFRSFNPPTLRALLAVNPKLFT